MAAAIRTATRQRSITTSLDSATRPAKQGMAQRSPSQIHLDALAFEGNAFWSSILAGELHRKFSNPARPLLHSRIRFQDQPARHFTPAEPNPNCLWIRAVAIAEALTIVVVAGNCAVCSGLAAVCGPLGSLLSCELAQPLEF